MAKHSTKDTLVPRSPRVIYIHGFNSSSTSQKAQLFTSKFKHYFSQAHNQQRLSLDLVVPTLPFDPEQAITLLESLIEEVDGRVAMMVGSSLGGYYATYLAEKYQLKAALINPAVLPCRHLGKVFLGPQKNHYTGEEYELTMKHVDYLRTLEVEVLQYPQNYLLLVQTGDTVLDYRLAVDYYQRSTQIVEQGGSHSFENFEASIAQLYKFSAL